MFRSSAGLLRKISPRLIGATWLLSIGSATYYRPLPMSDSSLPPPGHDKHEREEKDIDINLHAIDRKGEIFCSDEPPAFSRDDTPVLLGIAQKLSIGITTVVIRLFMNTYGEYSIHDNEHYEHFVKLVLGGKGRKENKQGLLTVSNHRTLFDDPGVVSCLLPLWIGVQPKYNRWGICSQEYCFSDLMPTLMKGYIGAGQVLPIKRGGGINQTLFRDFASLVARGEWCHIFPEGGVWQWNELGGRGRHSIIESEARGLKKSKLKWGVGKLIAHAPNRPRVVPFAHVGMENLLPQDPKTRKTYLKKKIIGGAPLKLRIQFGAEIYFDDLIEEHESQYGKLWIYGAEKKHFVSSEVEKELYRKIAVRIQHRLETLTKEVLIREIK